MFGALALFGACSPHNDDAAVDQSLWPSNATQLVFVDAGGGLPAPMPAGSDCSDSGAGSFTVTVADRKLSWDYCALQTGAGNKQLTDSRMLTADELQSVITAVKGVSLSTRTSCGADKPSEKLEISTPAGSKEYLDDFYACNNKGVYVANIDAVYSALYGLAFPAK
jgi:hypothetical protein